MYVFELHKQEKKRLKKCALSLNMLYLFLCVFCA